MVLRTLYLGFIFATAFMFSGITLNIAVRTFAPTPYMGLLTDKIVAFEQNKDKIDILFVGTSRTFRQMNTPVMERYLQKNNCNEVTLFNLGVPNLTYPELLYVLDQVYAQKPERLKMVILGEHMPAVRPQLGRLKMDRIRYFSNSQGTFDRFTDIISYQESSFKKAGRLAISLIGFTYEHTNTGHLSRLLFPVLYAHKAVRNAETKDMPKDWWSTRGYFSLQKQGHVNKIVQKRHEQFLQEIDAFEQNLTAQKKSNPAAYAFHKSRKTLYAKIFERIKENGQEIGLYLPPLPERTAENKALSAALEHSQPNLHLFHYNDPALAPDYWSADLWFDEQHLNDTGSRKLSLDIAKALCPITKEWGKR